MTRGGRFPRWRWQTTYICPEIHVLGDASDGASVFRAWQGGPWHAAVGNSYGGLLKRRRFHRRCDAKRWCERMMATRPAENGREE